MDSFRLLDFNVVLSITLPKYLCSMLERLFCLTDGCCDTVNVNIGPVLICVLYVGLVNISYS